MLKSFLLCAALTMSLLANAQQARVVRVTAFYDADAVTELYNTAPLGLQLVYSDSSIQKTAGLMEGNLRWNKLKVSSNNGSVQNGILTFNRQQLVKDDYRIILNVTTPDNTTLPATLQLPNIVGIRFNHYADSVKRDIRFYLNIEGKFSSGKVFPLDTTTIRFAASDGKIIGQDLLLPKNDTIKYVTVEAWYKTNERLYLRSVLPVKQAPDADSLLLKNTDDLFKKKKKRQ
ncbi:hypothetical protein [Chitinophaga arvensicola]|uniref:DUF3108 domain-containing protein n=1 Tax=Chitinophaga arvensicola TaxID=29529 RepID=A0A1I0SCZ2_9BACT|nr:hypothetical protein [Chitinophaga arvensicola]SEW55413.1 hypothetical protein SAMN04488122_6383 [Chitinophaga arvensicola]